MAGGTAFYQENNLTQRVESGGGYVLVGQLDLEPGEYLVWGKISAGVNASSGYPPPALPYAGGHALLAYADAHDSTYVSIQPESGANNETVTLLTAGKTASHRSARLYFANPYPLPVFINALRMAALRVDGLVTRMVGESADTVPEDPAERLRKLMLRSVYDHQDVAVHIKGG